MNHIYLKDENVLVKAPDANDQNFVPNNYRLFSEHLASLPRIPVSGNPDWKDRQEVVEGIDFEFKDLQPIRGYGALPHAIPIDTKQEGNKSVNATRKFERLTGIFNARQENEYHLPLEALLEDSEEKSNELKVVHKGIEFAKSDQFKHSGEPYRMGVGFGFSCGYEQAMIDLKAKEAENQDELWNQVEEIFDKHTRVSEGGYGADYTDRSGFIGELQQSFTLKKRI